MADFAPQEIRLAHEIADTLDDRNSVQLFLYFTQKYTEDHLRKVLNKVMAIPERKIKKTRGALFTYLISQHENGNSRS
jgi:hypothetical protein